MKIQSRFCLAAAVASLGCLPAVAQQVPPFFGGGIAAYDPEVSVIQSGALMDVRATVSADRKYVTLEMRNTNSNVRSLEPFPVVAGPQGIVGGAQLGAANAAANAGGGDSSSSSGGGNGAANHRNSARGAAARGSGGAAAVAAPSPDAISRAARSWILARSGMYLVKPLD
jgi:hypothetical protein